MPWQGDPTVNSAIPVQKTITVHKLPLRFLIGSRISVSVSIRNLCIHSTGRSLRNVWSRCFSKKMALRWSVPRISHVKTTIAWGRGIIDLIVQRPFSQVRLRHDCPQICWCKISTVLRLYWSPIPRGAFRPRPIVYPNHIRLSEHYEHCPSPGRSWYFDGENLNTRVPLNFSMLWKVATYYLDQQNLSQLQPLTPSAVYPQ